MYIDLEKTFRVQPSRKEGIRHFIASDLELIRKVKFISSELVHSIPRKMTSYSLSEFHYFSSIGDAGFQVSVIKIN